MSTPSTVACGHIDALTVGSLAGVLARCDDTQSHALWLTKEGEVQITALGGVATPSDLLADIQQGVFHRTLPSGHGHVGPWANTDQDYVGRLLLQMRDSWSRRNQPRDTDSTLPFPTERLARAEEEPTVQMQATDPHDR